MTVITIPAQVSEVPEPQGDPDLVETFAHDLLRASASYDDLDSVASNPATLAGWQGHAAESYGTRIKSAATDAATISLTLRAAARAAQDYGDELRRLREKWSLLVSDRVGYHNRVEALLEDVNNSFESDVPELTARSTTLDADRSTLVGDIADLIRAIVANDESIRALLASHATMEAARVTTSDGDSADAAMRLPGSPTQPGVTPEQTAEWWRSLSESEQDALIAANPQEIGSADGVPAEARNEANRILLDNDIAVLEQGLERGEFTADQQVIYGNAIAARDALKKAAETTVDLGGGRIDHPEAFLYVYDPRAFSGDGAVAISIGNPDTAKNVVTMVPGVTNSGQHAVDLTENAANVYSSAMLSDPSTTVATMMWMGYDAPSGDDFGNAAGEGAAIEGGRRLANHVDGIVASRGDDQPHMTVIGHSYGSTTTAHAATDHGLDVDNVILVGSPGAGSGVQHASQLGVPEVWVGTAAHDHIPKLSDTGESMEGNGIGLALGHDVAEDSFGAKRFTAEHPDRGSFLGDHSLYFDLGTESLFNIGQIVVNDDTEVTLAKHTTLKNDHYWDPEYHREPAALSQEPRQPDAP